MRKIAEKIIGIFKVWRKHLLIFLAGAMFAVVCLWIINLVTQPFSKSEYCGSCHEMQEVYQSWKTSIHYANRSGTVTQCIDCHLPCKDNFFVFFASKTYYGAKDIYKHYFGGQYDIQTMRLKVLAQMPNDRCLYCHASLMSKPISPTASRIAHQQYFNRPMDDKVQSCMACHYGSELFHAHRNMQKK